MQKQGKKIPQPNSVRKLSSLWRLGALPRDVGVHQVRVYHDAWGGIYQQQRCNGDPHMRLKYRLSGTNN
jgi:hypothetical protein